MRSSPSWFRIEAFLLPLDTFPTYKMLPAVGVDVFDDVIGFAIASFATMDCVIQ